MSLPKILQIDLGVFCTPAGMPVPALLLSGLAGALSTRALLTPLAAVLQHENSPSAKPGSTQHECCRCASPTLLALRRPQQHLTVMYVQRTACRSVHSMQWHADCMQLRHCSHPATLPRRVAAAGRLLEREVLADAGAGAAGRAPGLPAALGRPAACVAVAGHRLEAGLQAGELNQVDVPVFHRVDSLSADASASARACVLCRLHHGCTASRLPPGPHSLEF